MLCKTHRDMYELAYPGGAPFKALSARRVSIEFEPAQYKQVPFRPPESMTGAFWE
jgi:hypothetical protein